MEPLYIAHLRKMRYGKIAFIAAHTSSDEAYNKGFVPCGTPKENIARTLAATNGQPLSGNVDELVVLSGQRLRWDIPGERSVAELYATIGSASGADIDTLRELSPFIHSEEQRPTDDPWTQPFATETAIARLAMEALFKDAIDWKNYPVSTTIDPQANEQYYDTIDGKKIVPARTEAMYTYHLKDGRRVHVMNGTAQPRPQGTPRPTADSQTREAVELLPMKNNEKIIVASSAPHVRVALDAIIRIIHLRKGKIGRADIATARWLDTALIGALGEIPATHKADMRLRAALKGKNPDSPELVSL